MKKYNFLNDLIRKERLELVEPSENMCVSYLEKADSCVKSAGILLQNNLLENSISMSYYAMYNSLTALFSKAGIKCENHSASILLFKEIFNKPKLFKMISTAKKERIDKQYYLTSENDVLTNESSKKLLGEAEDFVLQIKSLLKNINNADIEQARSRFNELIKHFKKSMH